MLLTYACEIGDSELKASIIDIYATKALSERVSQRQTLTDEQSKFLGEYYEEIRKKIESWLGRKGFRGTQAEDMASAGMEAAIDALFKYWEDFEENEKSKMIPLLITSATNEMAYLLKTQTDFGQETKSWSSKVIPSVENYLDQKLRQMGYTNFSMVTEDVIDELLEREENVIERMVKEENERRDKKTQELRQKYIEQNGTDEGFSVPQKYKHISTGKTKTRYKTQKLQIASEKTKRMDSLDRSLDDDGGRNIGETISENNLFDMLGFDFSASPEEQIMSMMERRERMQLEQERKKQVLNIVYNLPPSFRVIMASAFNVDIDILQRGNELDEEVRKIAEANNLPADQLLAALKTAGGKRLAWSSVKKIMQNTYEDNPLVRKSPNTGNMVSIKNRDEFLEILQDKFMDIARNMGI